MLELKSYRLDDKVSKALKILKIELNKKNMNEVFEYLLNLESELNNMTTQDIENMGV